MLTEQGIENLPIEAKAYRAEDVSGLYLLVTAANKFWRLDYDWQGMRKTLALGVWPALSLEAARDAALQARQKVAEGVDPDTKEIPESRFATLALLWLERQTFSQKRREDIRRNLNRDLLPAIGSRKVETLTAGELEALLSRILAERRSGNAWICKHILRSVFGTALRRGLCQINPVAMLDGVLPPRRYTHYPALLDPKEIATLFHALDGRRTMPEIRLFLELLPYVFTRPGELRLAEWSEFDFHAALWTIPAERMKLKKEHLVPLSTRVLALLEKLRGRTGEKRFVFCGWKGKPVTGGAVARALRGTHRGKQTAHGFRAMARTLLHERLHFSPDAIEAQLAHSVPDRLGRAYNRAQHLEERIRMMQAWADYLDGLRETFPVGTCGHTGGTQDRPFGTHVGTSHEEGKM